MHCNKCKTEVYDNKGKFLGYHRGRVFVDQVFSGNTHVELFCVRCGKRWMIDKTKGAFGAWLDRKVRTLV